MRALAINTDRREGPRHEKPGWIQFQSEGLEQCEGLVADSSAGGFCAVYKGPGLPVGTEVTYRDADKNGRATVTWTRTVEDCSTSGFRIQS